jgi:hypothetical protein
MSASFDAILDGLEMRIAALERALETGSWDEVPAWVPPESAPVPGPEAAERLASLLARAETARARLLAALEETAAGIRAGRASARAARGYLAASR